MLKNGPNSLYLYLDLNSFFASCEQQDDPSLRNRPLGVVPTLANTTSCIAASYEAKKYGVKTGTKVGDAKKMCPGIQFRVANHDRYVKYHHRVIDAVDKCLPIHAVCSIDEIACELTGTQKDIHKAKALALKIKEVIASDVGEYLTCSIGIAPNVLLAKMASDMQKPNGLTVIESGDLPHKLYQLKLSDIPGVGKNMELRLHRFGVRTIEQLLSLNEKQMRAIWGGVVGARFYQMLRGVQIDFGQSETKSIGHQHVLPPNERTLFAAKIVAHRLISKAALRLRRAGFMARQMNVYVKFFNEVRWYDTIGFHETQDTSFFINKFNELYEHVPKNEKPLKVSITLSDFISEKEHQLSFFTSNTGNTLFRVVDEINSKYGRDTVYIGSLHEKLKSAPTRIAFSRIPDLDEVEE